MTYQDIVDCIKCGNLQSLERMIENLGSINEYIYADGKDYLNMLHLACGNLDSPYRDDVIKLLIDLGADIDFPGRHQDIGDIRPLHIALLYGHSSTLELLLRQGADLTIRDAHGLTPVDYADDSVNLECISVIQKHDNLVSPAARNQTTDSSPGENSDDGSDENEQIVTPKRRGRPQLTRPAIKETYIERYLKTLREDWLRTSDTKSSHRYLRPMEIPSGLVIPEVSYKAKSPPTRAEFQRFLNENSIKSIYKVSNKGRPLLFCKIKWRKTGSTFYDWVDYSIVSRLSRKRKFADFLKKIYLYRQASFTPLEKKLKEIDRQEGSHFMRALSHIITPEFRQSFFEARREAKLIDLKNRKEARCLS